MDKSKLVSVIIPTYNRQHLLGNAIESVLNQDYKPVQLIVIDDGSTDQTADFITKYPELLYIRKDHAGQAAARNLGLANAQGEYIASLDSDDIWSPTFLSTCVRKLEADNLDFVFANWKQRNPDGKEWNFLANDPFVKPYLKNPDTIWYDLSSDDLRLLYLNACPSPSSAGLIRKSSVKQGWNNKMRIGDDWFFYLNMILHGNCKAAFTLETLWSKKSSQQNLFDGRKWNEVLEHLYIHDIGEFIAQFRSLISSKELKILQRKHVQGLVGFARYRAFRCMDFSGSLILLKKSAAISRYYTLRMIPSVLKESIINRIK